MEIPKEYVSHVDSFVFPYLVTEREYRYIKVEQRGRMGTERWAILDNPFCYNRVTQEWEYEVRPSERDDDWMAQTRMLLGEALPLAKRLCAEKKVQALNQISQILAIRAMRAEENGDPRLEEYLQDRVDWEAERKRMEEQ